MRESFVIHTAYIEKFKRLTDSQFGFLIRSLMVYQQTGDIPTITDNAVAFAFDVAKVELDIANQKYDEVCKKRREAGSKGGLAKVANASKSYQKLAKQANVSIMNNDNENDNDNDNDFNIISVQQPRTNFTPPTVEEVRSYCQERNNNVNANSFVDFYTSKNWMIGKNKMKDWRAAVRTWERTEKNKPTYNTKPNQFQQFTQRDRSESDFAEIERRKLGLC